MTTLPFERIRVIDCATGLAGSVAAMMLGQAGAEVVKVEPPGGDSGRGTAAFAARNQGKRSIILDFKQDSERLAGILNSADVLIYEPGFPEDLIAAAPHIIASCIRPLPPGFDGPDLPADDLLIMAAVGLLDEQPATNRDGPAFIRLPFGSWCAAWLASIGIAARLVAIGRGAAPGPADTSLLQGMLLPSMMLWRDAQHPTEGLEGRIDKRVLPSIFECADGFWLHIMKNADDTPLMKRLLEEMGPEQVAAANAEWPQHFRYTNWGANVRAFKSRSSAEWLADLWAADIPVQPAGMMGELYADPQAKANRYVVRVDDPQLGCLRVPGAPVTMSPPACAGHPAPAADADRDAVLKPRPPALPQRTGGARDKPLLDGVRVVDFGNYLAGPLSTMLLADLGASVIKVEPPGGDPMRANESAFLACQRGKRSLVLNLGDPAARPVIERLVRNADIVHHNIRLPTARRFGISYEDLKAVKPDVVFGHVSAYGPRGDRRYWPGYDQLFQAASGWEMAHAGTGNRPAWLRFGMMDHLCAGSLAYGMLAALYRRDLTGEGGEVAASLLGTSILTMSEVAMREDGSLTDWPGALDADQTGISPGRRLARCSDGWIALSGPDQLAPAEHELEALSCAEALSLLADRGIDAVRVRHQAGKDFVHNAAHSEQGLVACYDHPVYGALRLPGALWDLGSTPLSMQRPQPLPGQHSEEVLNELGFTPAEIDGLLSSKVATAFQSKETVA